MGLRGEIFEEDEAGGDGSVIHGLSEESSCGHVGMGISEPIAIEASGHRVVP